MVAHVREEQDLLESLARLVERPGPLSPELFGAVERLAAETIAPPLAASLQELRRLEPAVVPGAGAH